MSARDYQPGDTIPGTIYRVVRTVGAGGMGTVYDVEDTSIDKRYVLKTLHPRLGSREDLARRMQVEARTLAKLHHPNIVEVITAGVTGDDLRLPFYVMERLDGQSLRLVLEKKGRLEVAHAYNLGIDLLDALDHAHDKGIVHRDVKPDNIFLHRSPSGSTVTKLLDFGIVSLLDQTEGETAGRFLGTLRYAAPEQLRGEKPTPKMDIYAAALVLYEVMAGHGPFDDEGEPHRIGAAHLHKRPPPLSSFVSLPHELERLLMAALSKDPAERPRDAFSFAASLRNIKHVYPGYPDAVVRRAPEVTASTAPSSSALAPTAVDPAASTVAEAPAAAGSVAPATDADQRGASTRSVGSAGSDSTRVPFGASEGIPTESAPTMKDLLDSDPDAALDALDRGWEHHPVLSEEPQVRSVPAAPSVRRPWGAIAAASLGVAGLAAIGLVALRSPRGAAVSPTQAAETTSPAPRRLGDVPSASPVVAVAAPMIALPPAGFDELAGGASGALAPGVGASGVGSSDVVVPRVVVPGVGDSAGPSRVTSPSAAASSPRGSGPAASSPAASASAGSRAASRPDGGVLRIGPAKAKPAAANRPGPGF